MKRKRRRLTVKTVREIIRLFNLSFSVRKIASSCNISISTVSFYVSRFKSSDITYGEFVSLADEEIKIRLFLKLRKEPKKVIPDMEYIYSELKRQEVTLYLLWEEYIKDNPAGYRYTRFCCHYGRWKKTLNPVMRFNDKMGEKVFVDFSGYKPTVCYRQC